MSDEAHAVDGDTPSKKPKDYSILHVAVGLILLTFVLYLFGFFTTGSWDEGSVCSRYDTIYNLTEKEQGCRLDDCRPIPNKLQGDFKACSCEASGTLIYLKCASKYKTLDYKADNEKIRNVIDDYRNAAA